MGAVSSSAIGLTPLNLAVSEVNSQSTSVDVWGMLLLPSLCDFSDTGNATSFLDSPVFSPQLSLLVSLSSVVDRILRWGRAHPRGLLP